eukprot:CAMPEP_0172387664 /NCGR_PEP_ID=MMETSP1061-20121228/4944_1 /TAXON_ID=37318 /ORGANISM="Pseudo-nitzschia pungens, Strain cf. pungens" /LENGTH=274 /DNA_ID=CAMNT_0013117369 /DNA_START=81 /DNA_END=902 /DNA_ORIENTATION=+
MTTTTTTTTTMGWQKSLRLAVLLCFVIGQGFAFVHKHRQLAQRLPAMSEDAGSRFRAASESSNGDGDIENDVGNHSERCATNHNYDSRDSRRRLLLQTSAFSFAMAGMPTRSNAMWKKSRTDGYSVQQTDDEWKSALTPRQYEILRNGGTERQYSSVLEAEERDGTYNCAACQTPLFASAAKFHSGTGWPSFATALKGVEIEPLNVLQANLGGAELRCKTCGGHLGDVFRDGYVFVGTPAAESGKRFCIDGSALVFEPADGGERVVGDEKPSKV